MRLTTEQEGDIVEPSAPQVERALDRLALPGNGYAILAAADQTYIQTSGSRSAGYIVEYRNGSEAEHYSSKRRDISHREMVQLFLAYHSRGNWRAPVEWVNAYRSTVKGQASKFHFSKGHKFLLAVFLAIGATSISAGGYAAFNVQRLLQRAVEVPGTVVKMVQRGNMYSPIVEYTDQRGNLRTLHTSQSSSPPSFYAGQKVLVVYDPSDEDFPLNAKMRTFSELWGAPIFLFAFGTMFAGIAGAQWFIISRRRSGSRDA